MTTAHSTRSRGRHLEYGRLEAVPRGGRRRFSRDIINSERIPEPIGGTILGDSKSIRLLCAIVDTGRWIRRAQRNQPVLCLCCPRRIRQVSPTTAFGVVTPETPKPGNVIAFAFCDRCSSAHPDLMAKAGEGFRQILGPDLRPIRFRIRPEAARER